MKIAYLDGPRLRRALLAACEHVQHARAELNRINVFPVPDGDTGTNLALTLRAIADRLRRSDDRAVGAVAEDAAEAGILGARGNVGMILSHFLLSFADSVRERARLSTREFADALSRASAGVYGALDRPVEGTILTVIRETAEEAEESTHPDFARVLEDLLARSRTSLDRTPELLPQLRSAGVVDAGAKGFVHFLEGIVAYMHGDPLAPTSETRWDDEPAAADVHYPSADEAHRYCTEALVRGGGIPSQDAVKDVLRSHGDSVLVIEGPELLKVHVHTDEPEDVFGYLRTLGKLATHKAEDMRVQHDVVERGGRRAGGLARRPVGIVTDSGCDLPDEVLQAHGIRMVPLSVVREGQVLRDRLDIDPDTFFALLREGDHPTTSQPPPAAFFEAYREAAIDAEEVVAVTLASALSGTFASADAAAGRVEDLPVHLVDSRGASLLEGLLVLKACELAESGVPPDEIAGRLRRIRDRSGILFTVDTFDRLVASGRVSRGRAWIGEFLDIKPILDLDDEGKIEPVAKVRGRHRLLPRVVELLEERIPDDPDDLRFGVVHVDCPEILDEVSTALERRYGDPEILAGPATPVISTHTGPGAWGVAYLVDP